MFFWSLIWLAAADNSLIEQKLTTDKEFYDGWMDLIQLQVELVNLTQLPLSRHNKKKNK